MGERASAKRERGEPKGEQRKQICEVTKNGKGVARYEMAQSGSTGMYAAKHHCSKLQLKVKKNCGLT